MSLLPYNQSLQRLCQSALLRPFSSSPPRIALREKYCRRSVVCLYGHLLNKELSLDMSTLTASKDEGSHFDCPSHDIIDINFQVYNKVSSGSNEFSSRICLGVQDSRNLVVKEALDARNTASLSQHVAERSFALSVAAAEPSGPLTNLLYRLNNSPSTELLKRAAEVDQEYNAQDRIAWIDLPLKGILREGEMSHKLDPWPHRSSKDFFRAFGIEHRDLNSEGEYGDEHKNLEDYDPDQEPEVYEYSSDPTLELPNPLGATQASVKQPEWKGGTVHPKLQIFAHVNTYRKDDTADVFPPRYCPTTNTPFPDMQLSPYLIIYSLAEPSATSLNAQKTFDSMLSHFHYMTMDEHHQGYSGFSLPNSKEGGSISGTDTDARWLIVQEFQDRGSGGAAYSDWWDLKRKEAKHWWYKNGWRRNSVAFYRLARLPEPEDPEDPLPFNSDDDPVVSD